MTEAFLKIVNMGISGSWIILAVLLLRFVLKKAPKWVRVLLWGVVAIRLICPFTIESAVSLIPSAETVSPEIITGETVGINSGSPFINNAVSSAVSNAASGNTAANINQFKRVLPILAAVWFAGIAAMLIYLIISCLRIRRKTETAVLLRNNIFQSKSVASPFVFGIIKPKIYLPFGIGEQDLESVTAHEETHIKRKDHLWKPLGFLLLAVYWFNPLMWLSYVLLCKDIELACDERVIKDLSAEQRANYSHSLLTLSVNRRMIDACPLAFGETGVKSRVKSVLNYKRPAFWVIIVAITASIVTAMCFLTSPRTGLSDELSLFIDCEITNHCSTDESDGSFSVVAHKVFGTEKAGRKTTVYILAMYQEYSLKNNAIEVGYAFVSPIAVTVNQTGRHGHYQLVEYWEPGEGSEYAADIKEKFPLRLQHKAFNIQKYSDELQISCFQKATEYFGINNAEPSIIKTYNATPTEEISQKIENEEFIITKTYSRKSDGMWTIGDNEYKYRLEITGRMSNAAKNVTFLVVSNSKDITFDQCWRAFGFSSQSEDYFKSDYAVIVGNRLFA